MPDNELEIKALSSKDSVYLSETLFRAFYDDPIVNWIYGDHHDMRRIFKLYAESLYLEAGLCFSCKNASAVMMLPPELKNEFSTLKEFFTFCFAVSKGHLVKGTLRALQYLEKIEQLKPDFPHYYIHSIGVLPEFRGKGFGSALLQKCIRESEKTGVPIYLENSKKENLIFYHRYGFELISEVSLGPNAPKVWPMIWHPTPKP